MVNGKPIWNALHVVHCSHQFGRFYSLWFSIPMPGFTIPQTDAVVFEVSAFTMTGENIDNVSSVQCFLRLLL